MAVVCGTSQRYIQDFSTGLYGKRYEGYFFDDFTHFNESNGEIAKPYSSIDAFVGSFDGRPYSWMWLGYFKAPTSGYYTFYIESNDSSWMWLGEGAFDKTTADTALIDNSGVRVFGLREKSATIYLRAGEMYPLRVLYGYLYDTDSMTLSFEGPNIAKTTDGTGYYFGGEYLFNASFGGTIKPKNDAFEFTMETTTANEEFVLPILGVTSIDVDWGDGTIERNITTDSPTHTYATAGTYAVSVSGSATSVKFYGTTSQLKLKTVTNLGSLGWTTLSEAFRECTNMVSFECGNCDTSQVTSMEFMFHRGFSSQLSLTTLDVSGFDTSNVTDMDYMFQSCRHVDTIDVSGFNTSNLTTASDMFRSCSGLTTLDVSGWDTSNLVNSRAMFGFCANLTTIDVSKWDTSLINNIGLFATGMFQGCTFLQKPGIENWDVTSISGANNFMSGYNGLTTLEYDKVLRNWSAQSLQSNVAIHFGDAQYTPGGSAEAARDVLVNTYGWIITDGGPVTNFNSAFEFTVETTSTNQFVIVFLTGVTSVNINWGDGTVETKTTSYPSHTYATAGTYAISVTGSATAIAYEFGLPGALSTVTNLGALGWTNFYLGFSDRQGGVNENFTSFVAGDCDTSNVTVMRGLFFNSGRYLTNIDVSGLDTSSANDLNGMFIGCSLVTNIDVSGFDTSNVTDVRYMFQNCSSLENLQIAGWNVSSLTDGTSFLAGANNALTTEQYEEVLINWASQPLQSGVRIDFGDATVTPGSRAEKARQYLVDKYDWLIIDGGGTLERNDAFELTIETTAASEEFLLPLFGVTSIDVDWGDGTVETGITTNNPTHTYATAGTHAISVTGSATTVNFNNNSNSRSKVRTVTNIGALGWTNFGNAFRSCSSMTSFECGDTDTSNVTSMANMFFGCPSATTIDVSGFDTSNVTSMGAMFEACNSVLNLDVSGFDTSSVTNMAYMFRNCSSLPTLDVSGFDTSIVTSMSLMFDGCSGLTALDVTGFDTSSVTNMGRMFQGCTSLTTLDVSGFDTSSVTTFSTFGGGMFQNCNSLENLDIDGWDVTSVTDATNFLSSANNALTTAQYDAVLIAWAAQAVQSNVTISFGDAQYTPVGAAAQARATLVDTYGWIITDGGAATFSPIDLFASSQLGAWYDPSDLTTLWTDTAGTTQATVGDAVARIDDKSGNGNHATQTTAASRPILREANGLYYLDFDGVDDLLLTGIIATTGDKSAALAATTTQVTQVGLFGTEGQDRFYLGLIAGSTMYFGAGNAIPGSNYTTNTPFVVSQIQDSGSFVGRLNGTVDVSGTIGRTSGNTEIRLGDGEAGSASYGNGNFYGAVYVEYAMTAEEMDILETYLAEKSGTTL